MSELSIKDSIVIGAGLTGLTTAHYLKKSGKDFILLEKDDRAGGVINTVSEGSFTYEEGPNTGVIGWPEVIDLFDDLKGKCEIEIANENVKKRLILKNAKWEALPSGLGAAIKTPLFTTGDKFRVLGEPFRSKGTNPDETLADLVRRRLGKSFLDYAIDPFILGIYAGDPSKLIPRYALPKLYNLEQNYGSFIKGTMKKRKEPKTEHDKKATRQVFSVKGGLKNMIVALCDSIGYDNIITEAKKLSVSKTEDHYEVRASVKGEEKVWKAHKVITTTGAHDLPDILPFVDSALIRRLTSLKYAKVVELLLGFDNWEGVKLDSFGGLIPFKENRDILGVLFLSSFLSGRAPDKGALLTLFIGGVRREELVSLDDEGIMQLAEREIKELMQLKDFNPSLVKIKRYNHAIPQYEVDSGDRFEAVDEIQNLYPGIIIGGNLKDGIGMADRIKQGKILGSS